MYFRFACGIVLVVMISLAGIALEKQNLELRRRLVKQHYQMDVLRDTHARLRLETQKLGSPVRMIDALEQGELRLPEPSRPDSAHPADDRKPDERRPATSSQH